MLPRIVVDSSVILKWLYRTDEKYLEQADKILQDGYTDKIFILPGAGKIRSWQRSFGS